MKENLINLQKTEIDGEIREVVSAKELHQFLNVKRDFSTWIKDRIDEYNFEINQDYISFPQNGGKPKPKGGRPSIDYTITLDMAKELAMVERTKKGREARQYFIECEKKLRKLQTQPQLSKDLKKTIKSKSKQMAGDIQDLIKQQLTVAAEATLLLDGEEAAKKRVAGFLDIEWKVAFMDMKEVWALTERMKDQGWDTDKIIEAVEVLEENAGGRKMIGKA